MFPHITFVLDEGVKKSIEIAKLIRAEQAADWPPTARCRGEGARERRRKRGESKLADEPGPAADGPTDRPGSIELQERSGPACRPSPTSNNSSHSRRTRSKRSSRSRSRNRRPNRGRCSKNSSSPSVAKVARRPRPTRVTRDCARRSSTGTKSASAPCRKSAKSCARCPVPARARSASSDSCRKCSRRRTRSTWVN